MSHTHTEHENRQAPAATRAGTTGIVLHSPRLYDLTVWLALWGKEQAFRESLLRVARVATGECVLDVGCGTGTLAIAAKKRVGPKGAVHGIDPSPEMLARAEKKAKKAGMEVRFQQGVAEALPFPDAHFDVVLSTVMLHHLPQKERLQFLHEIQRVLKPGGRVLIVDFEKIEDQKRTFLSHFHRPHGHVSSQQVSALLSGAGLIPIESAPLGMRDLHYVLAARPGSY